MNKEINIKDYFPAFDKFIWAVGNREVPDEMILEWAQFVAPYLEDGDYLERKFARQLLITYRLRLPHPPGCSYILFDFERPRVLHRKVFFAIIFLLHHLQVVACGSLPLAQVVCWGFRTNYKVTSFATLLRKGIEIEERCVRTLKRFKEV